jgi:hypothetical protein
MSKIEVNAIEPQSGTTLTLGASGDTVTLAAGASQSGFGRQGSVNWDTTPKTTGFTAVSGNGYFCNTTSSAFTVTLPATPTAGDIVAIADYANTSATNNITVGRNGSKIDGETIDATIKVNGQVYTLVYVDSTEGWKTVNQTFNQITTAEFVAATGGCVTTCGNYKIHTFTGPGTFTVTNAGNPGGSNTVDYLVVAGGGSGGGRYGGGGGGGGYRESVPSPAAWTASPIANPGGALPVSVTGYPITVGGGGTGVPDVPGSDDGNRGSNSIFSTITSAGGGAGAGQGAFSPLSPGGSGGGGSYGGSPPVALGGTGNTPPVSPSQGFPGGNGYVPNQPYSTAGGGGATEAGVNATGSPSAAGRGGAGATSSITGSPVGRSGGGGGSGEGTSGPVVAGAASPCGSGTAGAASGTPALNGAANRGGGSGAAYYSGPTVGSSSSGNGGSGIVVIRYKYQ